RRRLLFSVLVAVLVRIRRRSLIRGQPQPVEHFLGVFAEVGPEVVDGNRFAADDRGDAGEGDVLEDLLARGHVEALNHPAGGAVFIAHEVFGRVDRPPVDADVVEALDDLVDFAVGTPGAGRVGEFLTTFPPSGVRLQLSNRGEVGAVGGVYQRTEDPVPVC